MTNSNLSDKLIKDNDYIYVDENTNIIETVLNIIQNNENYNNIRKNGHKKALEFYQWENWANIIQNKIN